MKFQNHLKSALRPLAFFSALSVSLTSGAGGLYAADVYQGQWNSRFEGHDQLSGQIEIQARQEIHVVQGTLGSMQVAGPAILLQGRLVAAWAAKDKEVLLAVGATQDAGLGGQFVYGSEGSAQGTFLIERMTAQSPEGQFYFSAQMANTPALQGEVEVVRQGDDVYQMEFNIEGQEVSGVAIRSGESLVISMSPEKLFGVAEFSHVHGSQDQIEGRWVRQGEETIYRQQLERIPVQQ